MKLPTKLEKLSDNASDDFSISYSGNEFINPLKEAHKRGFKLCAQELLPLLQEMRDALEELQLGHEHNISNPDYRPLGETYGWCSMCVAKVGLNEDTARETLAKIKEKLE